MSSKKSIEKEDILESSVIVKEKKDNKTIYVLSAIIAVLCLFIIFMFFTNSSYCEKSKCRSELPMEKQLNYQYINFNGNRFKMSLDWKFISDKNQYVISNKKETMYLELTTLDVPYDIFKSSVYQKEYLQKLQTERNVTIDKTSSNESNGIKYYTMDGTYNNYNYYVVVIGDSNNVTIISAQFIDKLTYTNMKQQVIDFAISAIKNNKE